MKKTSSKTERIKNKIDQNHIDDKKLLRYVFLSLGGLLILLTIVIVIIVISMVI